MTEIAIRPEQGALTTADAMDRLEKWARQAVAVRQMAESICSTSFAPAAYRGKPDEATAAILAGAELGFDPMASLRAFDNIQGTPAPKAMTLRAVVQRAGHEVRIVESTPERAVVDGRRRSESEWQTSIWDLARAEQMGLTSKDQWKKQPAAMLVARATAEVCRWIASDAIMGMPYAAEEREHFDAPAPAVRKLTVADLDADLAELKAGPELIGSDQRREMFALWNELGFGGEENRNTRLELTAKFIGADSLESSSELTRAEADTVIAKLRERKAQVGQ